MTDAVNHPAHYEQAAVSLEPIDVLRYAPFDLGNALKYVLRAGYKGEALVDLAKAKKYITWAKESAEARSSGYYDFFDGYLVSLRKFPRLASLAKKKEEYCASRTTFYLEEVERIIDELTTEFAAKKEM